MRLFVVSTKGELTETDDFDRLHPFFKRMQFRAMRHEKINRGFYIEKKPSYWERLRQLFNCSTREAKGPVKHGALRGPLTLTREAKAAALTREAKAASLPQ